MSGNPLFTWVPNEAIWYAAFWSRWLAAFVVVLGVGLSGVAWLLYLILQAVKHGAR